MISINDMFRLRPRKHPNFGTITWRLEAWEPSSIEGRWRPYSEWMWASQMNELLKHMDCPQAPQAIFRETTNLENVT